MADYRLSYLKTLVSAAAVGLGAAALIHFGVSYRFGIAAALILPVEWSVALSTASVAMGAIVALYRDHRRWQGRRDLFDAWNEPRSERILTTPRRQVGILLRRICRHLLGGRWLLVGDVVEIRSFDQIQRTLDSSGCLGA